MERKCECNVNMKKLSLIPVFILIFWAAGSQCFAQDGFFQDSVETDFVRVLLKDSAMLRIIDSAKAEERNNLNNFLFDAAGNLINQMNLFDDIDLSTHELFSTNLSYSNTSAQKIVVSPWKIARSTSQLLCNIRLNINQKDKITTVGAGFGYDGSSPYTASVEKLKTSFDSLEAPKVPGKMSYSDFKNTLLAKYEEKLDSALIEYNKKRLKNVWQYNLAYNAKLFSVITSSGDANDFDSLNTYTFKSHVITIDAAYSHNTYESVLSGKINFIWERASAVDGQKMQFFLGPSFTAKTRIYNFLSENKLRKNEDYIKSQFIPSIYIGAAFEGKYFEGDNPELLEDGLKNETSLTFFFDVLITKSSQFRVGFPISRQEYYDAGTSTFIGSILQFNIAISNVN